MHPVLAGVAANQGGVFRTQQARQAGYRDDEIVRLRTSGVWVALRRGIYAASTVLAAAEAAGDVALHELHLAAARLALGGSPVASHRSAALTAGIALLDGPGSTVSLTVTGSGGTRLYPRLVVHRCALPPWARTTVGPPGTVPARTVVDLARTETFRQGVVAADSALHQGLADPGALAAVLEACAGWPGSAEARRVLEFADGRAEAPSESLARVLFAEQGLPAPASQAEIRDGAGLIGRVDFLFREQRTVVEVDGRLKYDGSGDALWREKRREDRLREAGYEVVRLTWAEILHHPERCAARIRAAFPRAAARRSAG